MSKKDRYKLLAIKSTKRPSRRKVILESRIAYDKNHPERIDDVLATQLRERNHSLGNHPAFPEDDEMHFEEKLISKRFKDVIKSFKRHHNTDIIDSNEIIKNQPNLIRSIIDLERKHKDELEQMAINLVREEFDIDEDDVEIVANLTNDLSLNVDKSKLKIESSTEVTFENHSEYSIANKEVYKRRMVNALIQGAAKKSNHMFNLIDDELEELEPQLPSLYSKLISSVDYMYLTQNDNKPRVIAGIVNVEFPKNEGSIPKIIVEGTSLPVIIHELVKGVMEILSYYGLPKNPKIAQFVIDKADFMSAETWDMRLGPPLWERFTMVIPEEDLNLKHYIYVELVSLPVEEFNETLREILMGSNTGKAIVEKMINKIKDDFKDDEFDNVVDKLSDDDFLGPQDLDNLDSETWFK